MITTEKTDNPILCIYDNNKVLNHHLIPGSKPNKILYINPNSRDKTPIFHQNKFILPYNNDFFRYIIFGSSGSYKTTTTANICTQFIQQNKHSLILYFSSILRDKYLDEVFKNISNDHNIIKFTQDSFKKIIPQFQNKSINNKNPNKNFIYNNSNEKISKKQKKLNELQDLLKNVPFYDFNSLKQFIKNYYPKCNILAIFDDIEAIPDSGTNGIIKKMLLSLQTSILTAGRSHTENEKSINGIFVLHNIISGEQKITRTYLNEADTLIFNLQAVPANTIKKMCEKNGLDNFYKTIMFLKEEGEKIIYMKKDYPFFISTSSISLPI